MINQSNFSKVLISILILKFLLYPFTFYFSMVHNEEYLNIFKSFLDNFIISMMLASLVSIFMRKLKN